MYPESKLPIWPILSFASFTGHGDADVFSIEDAGRTFWVTSGRIAIALGLQCEQIQAGDEVLLPAYCCSTMTEAIEAVGATPVFYKSHADLTPDFNDVVVKIGSHTKALLVVHFFGFPQEIAAIQQFCRERALVLIEDCAHAYFGKYRDRPLGTYGDFAVSSAMKFFPVSDGGCLVFSPDKKYVVPLHSGGRGFEAKAFINNIERSVRYRRFRPFTWLLKLPIALKDWVWSVMKGRASSVSLTEDIDGGESLCPRSSYGGYGFDASWMNVSISYFSRMLIRRLPRARIVEIRRQNYNRFLNALSKFSNATPLFGALPDDVVPYAFPLLVSSVDEVFPALKNAGVPILRWEDVDRSVCEVSSRYSAQLLQFPCHQDISAQELSWMIGKIQSALSLSS